MSRPAAAPTPHGAPANAGIVPLGTERRIAARSKFVAKKRFTGAGYLELLTPYLDSHESMTHVQFVMEANLSHRRILLLRHDIDHDYETALQMAAWEHDRMLRATYCVLHSAWYYGEWHGSAYRHTDELVRLCRELNALGHEVILHNNAITLALTMGVDPVALLREEIAFLRSLGLPMRGTSTHGDRLCRELNYNNYEIFHEAVRADRGGARTILGPAGSVRVGKVTMAELDLDYEAYDIARDIYITDSGGTLKTKTAEPGRRNFGRTDIAGGQVVGILTHPIWWRFDE